MTGTILRILTISKSDSAGGGASKVAQMLADAYAQMHPGSIHLCNRPGGGFGGHRQPLCQSEPLNKAIRHGHAVGRKIGFAESLPLETLGVLRRAAQQQPDVIHVHDTTSAVSPITLSRLARLYPLVWTMHDASAVTGGCIQPVDCTRFRSGCGGCPQRGKWPLDGALDLTPWHRRLREELHRTGLVELVTPLQGMADLAASSGMVARPPRIVLNPINTEIFAPLSDRAEQRRSLGLPQDGLILVTAAGNLSDVRKGMQDAVRIAQSLVDLDAHLVMIGHPDDRLLAHLPPERVTMPGFVSDEREMARWYGTADAFLQCSSVDHQPLTMMEAMACGVPVFGYEVGGWPNLIEQDRNGVILAIGQAEGLSAKLRDAVGAGSLPQMRAAARKVVVERHGLGRVVEQHVKLYAELIERRGAVSTDGLRSPELV